jgi:hypothetical protein
MEKIDTGSFACHKDPAYGGFHTSKKENGMSKVLDCFKTEARRIAAVGVTAGQIIRSVFSLRNVALLGYGGPHRGHPGF